MGGDIEGKFLVPIVDEGGGHYRVTLQEELSHLSGADELQAVKERIETLGFYYVTVGEDEIREMQADQSLVDEAFKRRRTGGSSDGSRSPTSASPAPTSSAT